MGVVTGAFNITAIIDGVNGTNGVAYGIRTNVESWHVNSDGLSPNALTWSFVVSDGTTTKVISSLVDAYAASLSPKYKIDEGGITTAPSSFRLKLYSYYKSVTIYLYKGDDIVAEKTIRASYGVLSVIQQYYLSSSNTELIGGAWSATRPTSTLGMYLWVRTLTTYTDGSYSTSEPLLWNNNIVAINKLISGDVEVQSDVYKVAEYIPLAPLVEGRKYRITLCATFAAETTLVELSLSRGYKVFASFNPYPVEEGEEDVEIVPTQQVFSFEFECDYFGSLTPDVNIEYANVRVSQNVTGYVSIIHWAQIEVGLVSETKMYALSTDRLIAPTGNWSTTMPVAVVGTYVWEKKVQVYDDGTQAEVGFLCLQGASGAKMRMRDWATRTDYLQGMSGEEYYDIVLYGGRLYRCTLSHKSSSAILPTNTVYWQIAQDWQFVATNVLLAKNAYIDLLEGNDIMAKDSDGNVTAGMSGGDDGIRFWAGATQENKATAPFRVNEQGESWLTNAHVSGEVNATSGVFKDVQIDSGTIGGFTINEDTLYSNKQGKGRIIIQEGTNRGVFINESESSPLFTARNDNGTVMALYSQGNGATALEIRCNSAGNGKALLSVGNSLLAGRYNDYNTAAHEFVKIAGLALSTRRGSNFHATSSDEIYSWVDFLVADGDITLPSAKNCEGKVLFVKAKGVISCQETSGGIVLADGTTIQVAKDRGNHAMIYISDGNSWYEFYCG